MDITSFGLALTLVVGSTLLLGFSAAYATDRENPRHRLGWVGSGIAIIGAVFAITGAIDGIAGSGILGSWPVLLSANVVVYTAYALCTRAVPKRWIARKVRDLPVDIQTAILKTHSRVGFKRAYIAAVIGDHDACYEVLRGAHQATANRAFLLASPTITWPVHRVKELDALIGASVQEHDSGAHFATDLSDLFEQVYADLLPYSGRITDENIDRIVAVASTFGITAAQAVISDDMPVEYLTALCAEPLGPRRRYWWEDRVDA